jgi:hypothetical protein
MAGRTGTPVNRRLIHFPGRNGSILQDEKTGDISPVFFFPPAKSSLALRCSGQEAAQTTLHTQGGIPMAEKVVVVINVIRIGIGLAAAAVLALL